MKNGFKSDELFICHSVKSHCFKNVFAISNCLKRNIKRKAWCATNSLKHQRAGQWKHYHWSINTLRQIRKYTKWIKFRIITQLHLDMFAGSFSVLQSSRCLFSHLACARRLKPQTLEVLKSNSKRFHKLDVITVVQQALKSNVSIKMSQIMSAAKASTVCQFPFVFAVPC